MSIELFHVSFFNYYGYNISDLVNLSNMAEPGAEVSLFHAVHF